MDAKFLAWMHKKLWKWDDPTDLSLSGRRVTIVYVTPKNPVIGFSLTQEESCICQPYLEKADNYFPATILSEVILRTEWLSKISIALMFFKVLFHFTWTFSSIYYS